MIVFILGAVGGWFLHDPSVAAYKWIVALYHDHIK
jgi:hypothetical protein